MFAINVGPADRVIRLIVGAALFLIGLLVLKGVLGIVLLIIGAILFLTGLTGRCAAYIPFGLNTARRKPSPPS